MNKLGQLVTLLLLLLVCSQLTFAYTGTQVTVTQSPLLAKETYVDKTSIHVVIREVKPNSILAKNKTIAKTDKIKANKVNQVKIVNAKIEKVNKVTEYKDTNTTLQPNKVITPTSIEKPIVAKATSLNKKETVNKYTRVTKASYYHQKFNGRKTASGERFNNNTYTAAHKTLPIGTMVRVTNVKTKQSVIVRINDRGPYVKGREIDLSRRAASDIGMLGQGVALVQYEVITNYRG